MNINLGCGNKREADSLGVDFRKTDTADVVHDLSTYPWPFKDCQFDNAYATDIIEHMLYVVPFVDECWRITKPGGHLFIRTTYFRTEQSYTDPTHLHYFTLDSFNFFDPDTDIGKKHSHYTDKKWKILRSGTSGQEVVFELKKR